MDCILFIYIVNLLSLSLVNRTSPVTLKLRSTYSLVIQNIIWEVSSSTLRLWLFLNEVWTYRWLLWSIDYRLENRVRYSISGSFLDLIQLVLRIISRWLYTVRRIYNLELMCLKTLNFVQIWSSLTFLINIISCWSWHIDKVEIHSAIFHYYFD